MTNKIFVAKKVIIIVIVFYIALIIIDIYLFLEKATITQKIRLLKKMLGS